LGRKVHPTGFRLGVIQDWRAKWYAEKHYVEFLREDLEIRRAIRDKYVGAAISLVEIDRQGDKILVNIHTARPGVVIGRGGQRVDEMRQYLEGLIGNKIQLNIQEIRQPELDAYLVAETVAEQISRRVAYRRAMKQAILRTLEAGARGMRISCAGRLAGAEIARREVSHRGQVPLHKLRADIDYGFTEAHTTLGRIGVKVWIYKGDILPEAKVEEVEEEIPAAVEEMAGTTEPEAAVEETASVESVELAPSVELEAQPEVVGEAVEVAPAQEPKEVAAPAAAEAEEKPKPRARKKVEAEVPAATEAEDKPKPKARKKTEAEAPAAAEAEEKPKPRARKKAEAEAPAAAEVEEKPKPKARKKAEAEVPAATEAEEKPKPRARKKAEAEAPPAVESGEQDVTTETS
jgi:small subunit ribosomal protein S3